MNSIKLFLSFLLINLIILCTGIFFHHRSLALILIQSKPYAQAIVDKIKNNSLVNSASLLKSEPIFTQSSEMSTFSMLILKCFIFNDFVHSSHCFCLGGQTKFTYR
ncbi:hypothetical protein CWC14_15050 [Pseudoalteromonas sp. S3260]|nr:hypothetical protein CWC14_15050 [Pseudoalteromonas sp. S3260]